MVWGATAARGIDDLVQRVASNDARLATLHIMKQRRFAEQDATKLFAALKANTTLTELYCSGHAMSTATVTELADVLSVNSTLQALCIGDSTFGDKEVEALLPGLLACASLQKLDLEHKAIRADGAAALGRALQGGAKLTHLVLTRNSLGDAGAGALASGGTWSCLQQLELSSCGITAKGLEALTLTSMPQLSTVLLSHNPLGPAGGEAVVKLLAAAPKLRRLLLAHTELQDEGVSQLAAGLGGSGVEELDVSHCGAAAASGAAFAAVLRASPPCALKRLQLGGGEQLLSGEAVAQIANSMAASGGGAAGEGGSSTCCCLTALDISRAQVDLAALRALAAVQQLESLGLLGCTSLGACPPQELCSALCAPSAFPSLQDLNIAGCDLKLPAVRLLLQRLQEEPNRVLPQLKVLAIGANEATEHEELEELLQSCQEAREGLHIHWRSGDGFQDERNS